MISPEVKLELTEQLLEPSVKGKIEISLVANEHGNVLSIPTYGVDARRDGSNRTVIVFQPWSDYVEREFSQARMDLVAETMNARVIGVDNLGVGISTSDIPKPTRQRLAKGDFSQVADLTWQAIRANSLFDDESELTLSYYSLGTTMAAAMAAHAPEGVSVDRLILMESAAFRPQHFGRFAVNYLMHGGDNWKQYLGENPDWVPGPSSGLHLAKRIIAQPMGHLVYPQGMASGGVEGHLKVAYGREIITPNTIVEVANGTDSKVSPTAQNDALYQMLLTMPVDAARTVYVGETHGMQDSFPRIAAALGQIARR